jgi:hypothetical protein
VEGGKASVEATDTAIYLAMTLRNVGTGLAVLDRWALQVHGDPSSARPAPKSDFHRLTRDLYIPPNDYSFWQGALRDVADPLFAAAQEAIAERTQLQVELLYGDLEGGQRTISRFNLNPVSDGTWLVALTRHFYIDRDDPR